MIRKALRPLFTDDLTHIRIGYLPITNEELVPIMSDDRTAQPSVSAIHTRKVEQEASWLRFMLISILAATFHALAHERGQTGEERQKLLRIGPSLLSPNGDFLLNELTAALTDGYSRGRQQQEARARFRDLYEVAIGAWLFTAHATKQAADPGQLSSLSKEQQEQLRLAAANDQLTKGFAKADNPFELLAKQKYRAAYQVAVQELQTLIASEFPSTAEMRQYLISRFEKVFFRGGGVEKNDILDMLIVCALLEPNTCIVTRDQTLRTFLATVHPPSAAKNAQL
jgi:hypothetical protein